MMNNKYGYLVDINKPRYRELYDRYKNWKGVPKWCPLSDAQRFEFEEYVLRRKKDSSDFEGREQE